MEKFFNAGKDERLEMVEQLKKIFYAVDTEENERFGDRENQPMEYKAAKVRLETVQEVLEVLGLDFERKFGWSPVPTLTAKKPDPVRVCISEMQRYDPNVRNWDMGYGIDANTMYFNDLGSVYVDWWHDCELCFANDDVVSVAFHHAEKEVTYAISSPVLFGTVMEVVREVFGLGGEEE